jgi:hypothetical protein
LKMIDLQLIRFCPASIELQFFLYLCSDKAFRDAHEHDLLTAYVSEFNSSISKSEPKLSLAELLEEYNRCRLFGALFAATMRPACILESGWVADNDGEVDEQVASAFIEGLPIETIMEGYRNDELFRKAVLNLLDELIAQLDIQFEHK